MSIDPVTTDASTGGSFNRYSYANNSPYKYVDPDGKNAVAAVFTGGVILMVGAYKYATDPKARAAMNRAFAAAANSSSRSAPFKSEAADTPKSDDTDKGDGKTAPPVPGELVGDQTDPRAGQRGKRHTSGQLIGGTGDAQADFDRLTGGTGQPMPAPNTYPPGTLIGGNGIVIRPGKGGTSIDIPGNGSKPPETLHYP